MIHKIDAKQIFEILVYVNIFKTYSW